MEKTQQELRAAIVAAHEIYGLTHGVEVCNYDDEESFCTYFENECGYYVEAFVFVPLAKAEEVEKQQQRQERT